MNKTAEIFAALSLKPLNEVLLNKVEALPTPGRKYLLAITPRAGSSFLSDLLTKTQLLGMPQEFLNQEFIPPYLANKVPANTADDYFRQIAKIWQTKNGVAGIKASWYQFRNIYSLLTNPKRVLEYKYIYLTRADLALQAVSLYKATESNIFHSVVTPTQAAIVKLNTLEYQFEKIDFWYQHIVAQEHGWEDFFIANNISPLRIHYDDIQHDWQSVVQQIGVFVQLKPAGLKMLNGRIASMSSRFKKIGDEQNSLWAERYLSEKQSLK